MAATKIPKGIELITQFVRGQFAKRSAKKTGIAGLKKASDSIVQSNVRSIEIILKNMGIDPNYLKSTDDVLKHMNIHKAMMNQHLRQQFGTLNLDKGIKSLEKKQPFQGFNPRVQQDVDSIIKDLKNMEPVAAMKEANLIIGRKGKYKNLSGDESQRILKETDDHIFQRDIKYDEFGEPIKPDPEDMASGGRTGYAVGKLVKGGKWFLNSLYDTKKQLMQLDIPLSQKKELMKQADDAIKHIEGGGPIPEQIIQHIRKDPKFRSVHQTRSADPDLAEMEEVILEYGKKHAEGGRIEMGAGGIMKLLKGLLKKKPKPKREKIYGVGGKEIDVAALKKKHGLDPETLKKDEEAFNLRLQQILAKHSTKHADGGRIGMMYGGDPGFAFEYGGSWADWHDQHRDQMPVEQYIKTKLPKHRLPFRELQSGGLAYMLGEPTYMKYGAGGSVGHAPWHKPTGQKPPSGPEETPIPQVAGTPDPLKAPRGIPSVAPKNMDPAHMQQQMMQKAMMGQQRPRMEEGGMIPEQFLEDLKRRNYHEFLDKYHRWKEDYERKKDLAPTQEAAGGGRIGFGLGGIDKGRRAFMKWLAGITGAGIAAGTGLLKLGKAAKVAKPAAAVTETIIKSNAPGMPSWFPLLVKRVLKEGKDETAKLATIERQTVHTAKTPDQALQSRSLVTWLPMMSSLILANKLSMDGQREDMVNLYTT